MSFLMLPLLKLLHLGWQFNLPMILVLVSHLRRGGNSVADALAKFVLDSTDSVWIEEIPSCITFGVATDLVRV
jgi:hypothetical protein